MMMDDKSVIQTVEIIKQPGQTLGFYIREGNSVDRSTGVFISRIAAGSVVAQNGLLRVNDEILSINNVDVTNMRLDDVVILMSIPKRLVLQLRVPKPCCANAACPNMTAGVMQQGGGYGSGGRDDFGPQPVVVLKSGFSQSFSSTVDDRSPDELISGGPGGGDDCYRGISSAHMQRFMDGKTEMAGQRMFTSPYQQQNISGGCAQTSLLQCGGGNGGLGGGEDSADSGLSSDNSGFSRAPEQRSPNFGYNVGIGGTMQGGYGESSYPGEGVYPDDRNRSPRGTMTRSSDGAVISQPMNNSAFNANIGGGVGVGGSGIVGRGPSRHVDYASDTDVNYYQQTGMGGGGGVSGGARSGGAGGSTGSRVPLERLIARYNAAARSAGGTICSNVAIQTSRGSSVPRRGVVGMGGGGGSMDSRALQSRMNGGGVSAAGARRMFNGSVDQYSSDSEVLTQYQRYPREAMYSAATLASSSPRGVGRNNFVGGGVLYGDDKYYSMPPPASHGLSDDDQGLYTTAGGDYSALIGGGVGKLDNLTLSSSNTRHARSAHPHGGSGSFGDQLANNFGANARNNSLNRYRDGAQQQPFAGGGGDYGAWGGAYSGGGGGQTRRGARNQPVGYRLTRKLSTDSLLDYKTYQMEEPISVFGGALGLESSTSSRRFNNDRLMQAPRSVAAMQRPSTASSAMQYNHAGGFNGGAGMPTSTMTLSRAQQHLMSRAASTGSAHAHKTVGGVPDGSAPSYSSNASSSSRVRNLQLSRVPLKIQTETFQPFQPDTIGQSVNENSKNANGGPGGGSTVRGLMLVHIYCGHGLKSSRTALRDLYCVVDVDAANKARTMIRTGAINFDWDEEFEIELDDELRMSFLVYSWDPHTRHRLCFSATLLLAGLVRRSGSAGGVGAPGAGGSGISATAHHRLAIRLEPKGILYVELNFRDPSIVFQRIPSVLRDALFGVNLKELVGRERSGSNVPLLMQRCVAEVERRGLDQVGIYRLCGSARRKQQLREEFERNVLTTGLSVEAVSDINVITGVLKDFLREMPEPLCSNCLYQMLLDALSVQLPGDMAGNAQFMWSILECLPRINQDTLAFLLDHLKRVSLRCDVNKMTTMNLAVCFGPSLICPSTQNSASAGSAGDSSAPASQILSQFDKHIELLKYLLDIWPENRGGRPQSESFHGGSPAAVDYSQQTDGGSGSTTNRSAFTSDPFHQLDQHQQQQQQLKQLQQQRQQQENGGGGGGGGGLAEGDSGPGEDAVNWQNAQSSPC